MGNVSETPTPNLSKKYGSTPPICMAVRPPFHLYGSTFGKILGVGVTGTFLI